MPTPQFAPEPNVEFHDELHAATEEQKSSSFEAKNKAALTMLAGNRPEDISAFNQIHNEYLAQGKSNTTNQVLQDARLKKEQDKINLGNSILLDPFMPINEKETGIKNAAKIDTTPDLREEANVAAAQNAPTNTRNEELSQLNLTKQAKNFAKFQDDYQEQILQFRAGLDVEHAFKNVIEYVLDPTYSMRLVAIIRDAYPDIPIEKGMLAGDALAQFKDRFRKSDLETQKEVLRKTIQLCKDWTRIGYQNDYLANDFVDTLFDTAYPTDDQIANERLLYNTFATLDTIDLILTGKGLSELVVAGVNVAKILARRVLKRVSARSAARVLSDAAPGTALAKIARALKERDQALANQLNVDFDQLTDGYLIHAKLGDEIHLKPDVVSNEAKHDVENRLNYDPSGVIYQDEERMYAKTAFEERKEAAENKSIATHYGKTEFEDVNGGYVARFRIGSTAAAGFDNPSKAKAAGLIYQEEEGQAAKVEILGYDTATGKFAPYDPNIPTQQGTQYLASVERRFNYDENALLEFPEDTHIGIRGVASGLFDKSSQWVEWFANSSSVIAANEASTKLALIRILEPLTDLKTTKQPKVLSLLDTGNQERHWFNDKELADYFGGDLDQIRAYNSVREWSRVVWQKMNERVRNKLRFEGWKTLDLKDMPEKMLGKILDKRPGKHRVLRAYDPATGTIIEINDSMIDELYNTGGKLFSLRAPMRIEKRRAAHVIIRSQDKSIVEDIPDVVLNWFDGWLPRMYRAHSILGIETVVEGADGVKRPEFIKKYIYPDYGSAEIDRRLLEGTEKAGEKWTIKPAKEIINTDPTYLNRTSIDSMIEDGSLWLSRRAPHELTQAFGKRSVVGVAETLERGSNIVARMTSLDHWIDVTTARWEKTYPDLVSRATGKMPLVGELDASLAGTPAEKARIHEAQALRNHIRLVSGWSNTQLRRAWRTTVDTLARAISTPYDQSDNFIKYQIMKLTQQGRSKAAVALSQRYMTRTLVDDLKQANFLRYLILNPIRQVFLQANQLTVYFGTDYGWQYFLKGPGLFHQAGLSIGLWTRHSPKWEKWSKLGARIARMPMAEYEQLVDAYIRSGLSAAVDSHLYAQFSAIEPHFAENPHLMSLFTTMGAKRIRNVVRLGRRLGFDAGEQFQLQASFLSSLNKWKRENPRIANQWHKPDNLTTITGWARAKSYNMDRSGAMAWQRGLQGLVFQFLSHTTKSLQVFMRAVPKIERVPALGKITAKQFSKWEAQKILMQQVLMWGTGAFGINLFFENFLANRGIHLDAKTMQIAEEGINGMTVNMVAAAIAAPFDEKSFLEELENTDIEVSQSFSPFGGVFGVPMAINATAANPLTAIVHTVFLTPDPNTYKRFILGPSYDFATDIADTVRTSAIIMGAGLRDSLPEGDTGLMYTMDEMMRILPSYSNFMKGMAAWRLGHMVNNAENPTVVANKAEAMAKMFFGLRSRRERQLSQVLQELRGRDITIVPTRDWDIRDDVRTLYNRIKTYVRRHNNGELDRQQMNDMITREVQVLQWASQEQMEVILAGLRDEIYSDLDENNEVQLVKMLTRQGHNLRIDPMEPFIQRIENMNLKPEDKEAIVDFLRYGGDK